VASSQWGITWLVIVNLAGVAFRFGWRILPSGVRRRERRKSTSTVPERAREFEVASALVREVLPARAWYQSAVLLAMLQVSRFIHLPRNCASEVENYYRDAL